jgi:hypothetical protein
VHGQPRADIAPELTKASAVQRAVLQRHRAA